jgi:hypothetical protein
MAELTPTSNKKPRLEMSPTQPLSPLHDLPQELQEIIFAFAVVSPTPIPARIHLKDFETPADNIDSDDSSNTTFITRVRIEPSQPALSRTDKQTRLTVLRIFYTQNTFLFRGHSYQSGPLHKWLTATAHNYAPEARQMRRVMLEMGVNKTCGAQQQQPQPLLLVPGRRATPDQQRHLYRVLVAEQPGGDEGVRVRFGADLAVTCSCAMRTAGLLTAAPAQRGIFYVPESGVSAALSFAQDVEYELLLMQNCSWQFCDEKNSSACRDCGLRVHRREPMGRFLLQRTRRQLREEADRLEREAVREAERAQIEAQREAERLESERERAEEQAESAARWEASMGELNASAERLKAALRERMGEDKKQEKLKQGKPLAEARCVTM